jgi:twitching motility protein PilT
MTNIQLTPEFIRLLDTGIDNHASDIHIMANTAPMLRIDGSLRPIADVPSMTPESATLILSQFIGPTRYEQLITERIEQDFSFSYRDLRFRANVFLQKGSLAGSLRILPQKLQDLDTLGLPSATAKMLDRNQGLVIIAGPTGHGKSTTLASMINRIASERRWHILTVEDPIEYIFEHKKSIIAQREVGSDTTSFASALRTSLREDPDVVVLGEMRDLESIEAAMQIAETGHLVLTTLHTNSAAQTANRIIDVFPPHQQDQVRTQLSEILIGILSQRLLPRIQGGRILACELLLANSAVRSIIRDGKTHQLPNLIQTSAAEGMVSLDKSLAELVSRGEVSIDDALAWSLDPKALKLMIY